LISFWEADEIDLEEMEEKMGKDKDKKDAEKPKDTPPDVKAGRPLATVSDLLADPAFRQVVTALARNPDATNALTLAPALPSAETVTLKIADRNARKGVRRSAEQVTSMTRPNPNAAEESVIARAKRVRPTPNDPVNKTTRTVPLAASSAARVSTPMAVSRPTILGESDNFCGAFLSSPTSLRTA